MKRRLLIAGWMSLVLSACHSADRDLPREYREVPVPEATLRSAEAIERGGEIFARYCTLCHGVRGDGHGLQREGLQPPPRDFTDAVWRAGISPLRVFATIREGRSQTAMPSWKSLSERDSWDLTAYVLSLAGPQ